MLRILGAVFFWLGNNPSIAADRPLEYAQKLTISDGLAHNGVTSMLEDSKGYLWIGTYDGLNRYDGYNFEVYKNTLEHHQLLSNRVRTITEDKNGNIWIGTDDGISLYNYSEERFSDLYSYLDLAHSMHGPIVRKILMDEENGYMICAMEDGEVLIFNDDDYSFKQAFALPSEMTEQMVHFYDVIKLDKQNYLLASSIGIVRFNLKQGKFYSIIPEDVIQANSITIIGENHFLVTQNAGFVILKIDRSTTDYGMTVESKQMTQFHFNSAMLDDLGHVWLGTVNAGVIQIRGVEALINQTPWMTYRYNEDDGLLRVGCIVSSTLGSSWVGSFNKGLFRFDINENPFKSYNTRMNFPNGFKTNEILHMRAFGRNKIYVTANRGGLALFNTDEQVFEPLPFQMPINSSDRVGGVFVGVDKDIWIKAGSSPGVLRVRQGQSITETVRFEGLPQFDKVRPVNWANDKLGNLWIASNEDVYLVAIDANGETTGVASLNSHPFFKNKPIKLARVIYQDPMYPYIWIGTDADGLFRIEFEKNQPLQEMKVMSFQSDKTNPYAISSDFVSSIIRLPNGELWIGTERGGICKVLDSDKEPKFIVFSEKHGLSNNVVKSIQYDDEYNLWISTNIGLNKFNTKTNVFRKFSLVDGLPFEDFTYPSVQLDNGYFVFSGMEGLCYFKPQDINDSEALPKLEFGNFKVFNDLVQPGDSLHGRVLLDQRINKVDQISLYHNENVFSLELKSLHYSKPDNYFLKYQLYPVNNDWVEVPSSQRTVYYNGLVPGKYELRVMASNSLNQWTQPRVLKIVIDPPFWKTNWAYFGYVLLVALLIGVIMKVLLRINSLRHNLQIEKLEKQQVKELNSSRLELFMNISHEFRTPLTLVSGLISRLANMFKSNKDVTHHLDLVQRQSKKMFQLIEQVHDYQKAQQSLLKLNMAGFDVIDFIDDIKKDFEYLALSSGKHWQVKGDAQSLYMMGDRKKLEIVLNNLISNAFKFTEEGDYITLAFAHKDDEITLSVTDTGRGIDDVDLPNLFKRFYRSWKENTYSVGSGIGLEFSKMLVELHYGTIVVESELGEGSKFIVTIPTKVSETNIYDQGKITDILNTESEIEEVELGADDLMATEIPVDENLKALHVFVVEDNADLREFISEVLSGHFQVSAFHHGMQCLDQMEEEWPDLIVSDILMPEMNGLELCQKVKSDIRTSHIPIILLTSRSTIQDRIVGLEVGADAYINKPFDVKHLIVRAQTLLRNRQQLRERFQNELPLVLQKTDNGQNDHAFLEKLYELMAENLDNQDVDINLFAKELYLNRTHFYQKVKALTNQTPFELLKNYRLKRAAELLMQKDARVNEVYMMTGFKSRTHFAKLFKEKYHATPGKYAEESLDKLKSND
ncbi:response regulator [Reichenbachiella carrageenanivorans]|uniref:histidine kinase n=1 Tax=Reichenbachiella carrageenanivorans TaxID=2979869 RepID=A0ABY6D4Q3_9BACT|nr:two-component regulator propeller domain-containing protein [Reichenbachiella carrageenanivorans]UXX81083.1 response regulator [Reichenbachiella carrageenanivorans]